MRRFARRAYEAGIRYIGGCCFFEAYHIREIVDEVFVMISAINSFACKFFQHRFSVGSILKLIATQYSAGDSVVALRH